MKDGLKYRIFKTKWGSFGFLVNKSGLLRTVLPMRTPQDVKRYLLVGIYKLAREDKSLYQEFIRDITNYYKGNYVNFNKSVLPKSCFQFSEFGQKVIQACRAIPLGKTITYSQLAKRAGSPKASRAAGSVLAKNPIPLIVPCHRVIRVGGKIGNFSAAGGSNTKKKMLEHEKLIATKAQGH